MVNAVFLKLVCLCNKYMSFYHKYVEVYVCSYHFLILFSVSSPLFYELCIKENLNLFFMYNGPIFLNRNPSGKVLKFRFQN